MRRIITLLVVLAAVWGINRWTHTSTITTGATQGTEAMAMPVTTDEPISEPPARLPDKEFSCDGRVYCSQMTSCEEAKFFLKSCPGTKMDGDHNGIPCERQWCPGG